MTGVFSKKQYTAIADKEKVVQNINLIHTIRLVTILDFLFFNHIFFFYNKKFLQKSSAI